MYSYLHNPFNPTCAHITQLVLLFLTATLLSLFFIVQISY
nr:MAG TPA: hypothetical protein [Caudoviricetes sp.]